MCTISCYRDLNCVIVTMNRDEQRARGPERPPRRQELEAGACWVGPQDSQKGGTWVGLHSRGWAACLMNLYLEETRSSHRPDAVMSRGLIIPALMQAGWEASCVRFKSLLDLGAFEPFTLLLASPHESVWTSWDGRRLAPFNPLPDGWSMLSSSSWRAKDVLRWRESKFQEWLAQGAPFEKELPSFHLFQPVGRAQWAPLMDRSLTHTRSITQVRIQARNDLLQMNYWPRSGRGKPGPSRRVTLPRTAALSAEEPYA